MRAGVGGGHGTRDRLNHAPPRGKHQPSSFPPGLDFFFHMFFLVRYSKSLEEGSFRGRTADFLWMLLFGGGLLVAVAPFVNIQFLGSSLSFMLVGVCGWV